MPKYILTAIFSIVLLAPGAEIHAQSDDLDCSKCVDAPDIAAEAITTNKIRKKAVISSKIAPAAITTNKLKDGAITTNKLAPEVTNSIQARKMPRVLDGNDNEIGDLISIGENHWSMEVITQQGFLLTLSPRDGRIYPSPMFFATDDCTGTGYVDAAFFGGYVLTLIDINAVSGLFYIDKNAVAIANFNYESLIFSEVGCEVQSGQLLVFPALPNNPQVTGVSTDTFQLPIKIMR